MRLSAFTVCDSYPQRGTENGSRLLGFLRLAEISEEMGLDGIWVGEHHFRSGGVCPSPAVLLAAAAQRTRHLRLGVLASILPLHSAISVAEEYAMVDVLSGGRLNLGVGSGYVPEELWGHGVDPTEKRVRFDAALSDLIAALRGDRVAASDGARRDLTINIRPIQRPTPPIWIAVQHREAVSALARSGRSIAVLPYATVRARRELFDLITTFHHAASCDPRPQIAVAVHLYVGPEPERARAALDRYLGTRLPPDPRLPRTDARRPVGLPTVDEVERERFACFGSVEEVIEDLREYEAAGVDELLGMFDFGDLQPTEAEHSIRAIARAWRRPQGARPGTSPEPHRTAIPLPGG